MTAYFVCGLVVGLIVGAAIGVVLAAMCAAGRRADDERVRTLREQFEKAYTGPGPRVAVNDARLRAGRKPL